MRFIMQPARSAGKIATVGFLALTLLSAAQPLLGQAKKAEAKEAKAEKPPKLKVGDMAPDFEMKYRAADGLKSVSLHDYRGKKNVVLAFYVFAFTGG
jgi:AhpC/TSA family protein